MMRRRSAPFNRAMLVSRLSLMVQSNPGSRYIRRCHHAQFCFVHSPMLQPGYECPGYTPKMIHLALAIPARVSVFAWSHTVSHVARINLMPFGIGQYRIADCFGPWANVPHFGRRQSPIGIQGYLLSILRRHDLEHCLALQHAP